MPSSNGNVERGERLPYNYLDAFFSPKLKGGAPHPNALERTDRDVQGPTEIDLQIVPTLASFNCGQHCNQRRSP
jgi:hypothetical protein